MADDDALPDEHRVPRVAVQHGVVLDARPGADRDALDVAAQDRPGPDVRAALDHDVADDDGVDVDVDGVRELRPLVLVDPDRQRVSSCWDGTRRRGA